MLPFPFSSFMCPLFLFCLSFFFSFFFSLLLYPLSCFTFSLSLSLPYLRSLRIMCSVFCVLSFSFLLFDTYIFLVLYICLRFFQCFFSTSFWTKRKFSTELCMSDPEVPRAQLERRASTRRGKPSGTMASICFRCVFSFPFWF